MRVRTDAPLRHVNSDELDNYAPAKTRGMRGEADDGYDVDSDDQRYRVKLENDEEWYYGDEYLDADAQPTVLDRFAELAEDPAMLPVLEAAVDFFAVAKSGASSNAFQLALQRFMGAEC